MSVPMSADVILCLRRCSGKPRNVSADVSRHAFISILMWGDENVSADVSRHGIHVGADVREGPKMSVPMSADMVFISLLMFGRARKCRCRCQPTWFSEGGDTKI